MTNKVKNGWHVSKVLGCDFNVQDGIIISATDLKHTRTLHAYRKSDGYRIIGIAYTSRYNYKWH